MAFPKCPHCGAAPGHFGDCVTLNAAFPPMDFPPVEKPMSCACRRLPSGEMSWCCQHVPPDYRAPEDRSCVACGAPVLQLHAENCPLMAARKQAFADSLPDFSEPPRVRCAQCGVYAPGHHPGCATTLVNRIYPDFSEPPEEHRGVLLDEPNVKPTMSYFGESLSKYGAHPGTPAEDYFGEEIDYVAVAKVVTHAGRLHAAVRASVANLEASELAGVGTIAHVIRTLKDALDG